VYKERDFVKKKLKETLLLKAFEYYMTIFVVNLKRGSRKVATEKDIHCHV
jgi:hypothetical protein